MSDPSTQDPRAQLQYQVRFDWGVAGAEALSSADLVVWADQLDAEPGSDAIDVDAAPTIAQRVLALQAERGDRISVAVIATGGSDPHFAVEDFLAAGAVIDALADVGIDHCSPEAAAAGAAYAGLRNATRHLISASVRSRMLRADATST